jgi:6-phosphogluconolactonase/glucosamine-6-phosphate isomerase/deaminase
MEVGSSRVMWLQETLAETFEDGRRSVVDLSGGQTVKVCFTYLAHKVRVEDTKCE